MVLYLNILDGNKFYIYKEDPKQIFNKWKKVKNQRGNKINLLFNYCYQPRAYADSSGYCLVELEEGETIKDVLKKYIVPKDWFEQQYLNAKEITEYKHKEKNILRETCFNEYKSSVFRLKEMKEKNN